MSDLRLSPRQKEALVREATELAAELAKEEVPRTFRGRTSPHQIGVSRTYLMTFVTVLTKSRDLGAFRAFLKACPGLDEATAQNRNQPVAYYTTVAEILKAELDAHPRRGVDEWCWMLAWTARLLKAEETERGGPRQYPAKVRYGHPTSVPAKPKASHQDEPSTRMTGVFGHALAKAKAKAKAEAKEKKK